jgi:hypothetical protein
VVDEVVNGKSDLVEFFISTENLVTAKLTAGGRKTWPMSTRFV